MLKSRQGNLTEEETSVPLTSTHQLNLISSFYIENIIHLRYKTSYLKEEVNCTVLSPAVSRPWF